MRIFKKLFRRKHKHPQQLKDLKIRQDVYSFLTAPQPVLKSERKGK